jgi:hypothetical protein
MSSSERGSRPEPHETPPVPYHKTARFAGERPAGRVYDRLQTMIYTTPSCDLSVYRLQLNRIFHVTVLGEPPPVELDGRISRLLARGEPATLPDEVLAALAERRQQATRIAPWVERHERPSP